MEKYAFYKIENKFFKIGYREEAITSIGYRQEDPKEEGQRTVLTDAVAEQLRQYFEGERKQFDFNYQLEGTAFQKKVWKALCDIPYGETRSYKEIAEAIGHPKAYRAVGMANNHNPIMIAVPCHRVIGSNGKLIGYASGLLVKESLLALEKRNV